MNREAIESLKDIVRNPYAFPGGYEKVLLMADGESLCHKCAKSEFKLILHDTKYNYRSGWDMAGVYINWEEENLYCAHCNSAITSEYGEENAQA